MYAIIANGSKQYKAEVGATIKFEKLEGNVGDKVEFDVLMLSDENGIKVAGEVAGLKAIGEITEQGRDKKIIVFKYKAKKNERKKRGHRQPFTAVKITAIGGAEEKPVAKKEAAPKTAAPKTAATKKDATEKKPAAKKPAAKKAEEKAAE